MDASHQSCLRFSSETLVRHLIGVAGGLLFGKPSSPIAHCLAPVSDDEHEMLDLRTETTGGFAAITHVKIAPLTGVRV